MNASKRLYLAAYQTLFSKSNVSKCDLQRNAVPVRVQWVVRYLRSRWFFFGHHASFPLYKTKMRLKSAYANLHVLDRFHESRNTCRDQMLHAFAIPTRARVSRDLEQVHGCALPPSIVDLLNAYRSKHMEKLRTIDDNGDPKITLKPTPTPKAITARSSRRDGTHR